MAWTSSKWGKFWLWFFWLGDDGLVPSDLGLFSILYLESSNLASHLALSSSPSDFKSLGFEDEAKWLAKLLVEFFVPHFFHDFTSHLDPSHFGRYPPYCLLAVGCWRCHALALTLLWYHGIQHHSDQLNNGGLADAVVILLTHLPMDKMAAFLADDTFKWIFVKGNNGSILI